jgi:hypothetical protein
MNFNKIYEDRTVFDEVKYGEVDYKGEDKEKAFSALYDTIMDETLDNFSMTRIGDHARISLAGTDEAFDKVLPTLGYSKAQISKLKKGERL